MYHQESESSTGTKLIVNTFIANLEKKAFAGTSHKLFSCFRYLDDSLTEGQESSQQCFRFLNSDHPTIKLNTENSTTKLNSLHVLKRKSNWVNPEVQIKY